MEFALDLPPPLVSALLLGGALLAGLAVHALLRFVLGRLVHPTRTPILHAALAATGITSQLAIVLLAISAAMPAVGFSAATEATTTRILGVVLVGAVGWMFARMIGAALEVAARGSVGGEADIDARRRRTQLSIFRRLAVLVIGLVTAGLVLTAIPAVRNVGLSLFASAGVAGLIAGIAARPLLANLIAGIQIAVSQPIRIGDAVFVENEFGHVEEITATYVVIEIWDQRRLVLPLSYFLEKPFQSWTRRSPELLQPLMLYLDYRVPVAELRAYLHDRLLASKLWDRRVWNLQVTDIKERTVELRALVSAANSGDGWDLRCELREALLGFLGERYPQALPRVRIEMEPVAKIAALPQRVRSAGAP
jgi:small-conductance mechanosensitive channel